MRESTKTDLPKGIEAQCPICWRLFGSDSTCELHKPYRKPQEDNCKEPSSIGLTARPRRGLAVWVKARPEGWLGPVEQASDELSQGLRDPL